MGEELLLMYPGRSGAERPHKRHDFAVTPKNLPVTEIISATEIVYWRGRPVMSGPGCQVSREVESP